MPAYQVGMSLAPTDVTTRSTRPHTAHGPRGPDICMRPSLSENDRVEVTPAVAGARGVMR